MTDRLFKASEYKQAEAEHRRNNPSPGDYWYEDMYVPVLIVLSVAGNFVTICRKVKPVNDRQWTWDLTKPEIVSREEFVKRLDDPFCGVTSGHYAVVKEFEKR